MTDTVLVLCWLIFAHLLADFVLQNDWIAMNKGQGTDEGRRALATHGVHVALCLLPAVFAFGLPGLVYLLVVAVSHVFVDRWKVQATRRADEQAQAQARARMERTGEVPASGLGGAWTPWPGMLFLADQALHLTFAIVGWLVILESAPLTAQWIDFVNLVLRGWDRATVHAVVLTGVVLASLFIVNTRAAYYFVLALVSPRELKPVSPAHAASPAPAATPAPAGTAAPAPAGADGSGPSVPSGAPARIGATIGAFERLLIVGFILVGSSVAVGFVIAVKTIARFKQLDDRGFAEYYLLGTLASVSVAISSGYMGLAALSSLP
jgi:hypothetical protein